MKMNYLTVEQVTKILDTALDPDGGLKGIRNYDSIQNK